MHRFANPTRFSKLISALQPWAMGISVLCLATGLYFALIVSPADYQQSETVRIMYVHVPAAWMATRRLTGSPTLNTGGSLSHSSIRTTSRAGTHH